MKRAKRTVMILFAVMLAAVGIFLMSRRYRSAEVTFGSAVFVSVAPETADVF